MKHLNSYLISVRNVCLVLYHTVFAHTSEWLAISCFHIQTIICGGRSINASCVRFRSNGSHLFTCYFCYCLAGDQLSVIKN